MNKLPNYLKSNVQLENISGNFYVLPLRHEITSKVTSFYQDAPFPNYDEFDSIASLDERVTSNPFLKDLKKYIGLNKSIIEVGSGTSQLSIALAYGTNNKVVALDPTLESLQLGVDFAFRNSITNVDFIRADLFDEPILEKSFDVVWCSGVLHHTKNPKAGFSIIRKWVKPDGLIIIGLYNKYGRLWTILRRLLYGILPKHKMSKAIIGFLDPYLRGISSKQKINAWFRDQYEHPVESLHSLDETLDWFRDNNVEYLGSIPAADAEEEFTSISNFTQNKSNAINRISNQINMLFENSGKEGGLFIIFGIAR